VMVTPRRRICVTAGVTANSYISSFSSYAPFAAIRQYGRSRGDGSTQRMGAECSRRRLFGGRE
jgi:hypothetical protein